MHLGTKINAALTHNNFLNKPTQRQSGGKGSTGHKADKFTNMHPCVCWDDTRWTKLHAMLRVKPRRATPSGQVTTAKNDELHASHNAGDEHAGIRCRSLITPYTIFQAVLAVTHTAIWYEAVSAARCASCTMCNAKGSPPEGPPAELHHAGPNAYMQR